MVSRWWYRAAANEVVLGTTAVTFSSFSPSVGREPLVTLTGSAQVHGIRIRGVGWLDWGLIISLGQGCRFRILSSLAKVPCLTDLLLVLTESVI